MKELVILVEENRSLAENEPLNLASKSQLASDYLNLVGEVEFKRVINEILDLTE